MNRQFETIVSPPLNLKEVVRVDVFRGRSEGYSGIPDETPEVQDLIVNPGRVHLAKRIVGLDSASSAMAYMAVGTGSTAPALTNSILAGEVNRKLFASESATDNVWTAINTWGGSADSVTSVQIQEAGIFNKSDSGDMFQRVTFATVTLANSDLLKVTLETNVGSNTI